MRIIKFQNAVVFDPEPNFILSIGGSIRAVAEKMRGQIHDMPTPPFGPVQDIPRFVIQSTQCVVNISINRFDLHATPPQQIQSNPTACILFAQTIFTDVLSEFCKHRFSYRFSGLVTNIRYPNPKPQKTRGLAVQSAFERLVNLPPSDKPLSSFELRYGRQELDHFRVIKIDGYTLKNGPALPEQVPGNVESGIGVSIDVNNRPAGDNEKKGPLGDLTHLLDITERSILTLPEELNLKDLLI